MGGYTAAQPKVKAKAFFCPNCGGTVQLRGFAHTLTATCTQCGTLLDTSTPAVRMVQQFQEAQKRTPLIPLGSRGKFDGVPFEVIGFQTRGITADGTWYEWNEYLLFNPYHGFLYLTEYDGHWNVIRQVQAVPIVKQAFTKSKVQWKNAVYKHFQHGDSRTVFVLGEFPWRVQAGDAVAFDDFVAPPYVLSAEHTEGETTWSAGKYATCDEIRKAFGLKEALPKAKGIYSNQPNPLEGKVGSAWALYVVFLFAVVAMMIFFAAYDRNEAVLDERHYFLPQKGVEASFVTKPFELKGRISNVEVQTATDLDNNWAYFNYALINDETGQAYDFGREVSYYHGSDSDGSWSEGGANDAVVVPSVPPGRYYLRVEPEMDENASRGVNYQITVRRDVPSYSYFAIAMLVLALPPVAISWRRHKFEYARWQESDPTGASSASGGDD